MEETADDIINKAKEVLQKIEKYDLPVNIKEKLTWFILHKESTSDNQLNNESVN